MSFLQPTSNGRHPPQGGPDYDDDEYDDEEKDNDDKIHNTNTNTGGLVTKLDDNDAHEDEDDDDDADDDVEEDNESLALYQPAVNDIPEVGCSFLLMRMKV